jgi:hypothetical protein
MTKKVLVSKSNFLTDYNGVTGRLCYDIVDNDKTFPVNTTEIEWISSPDYITADYFYVDGVGFKKIKQKPVIDPLTGEEKPYGWKDPVYSALPD